MVPRSRGRRVNRPAVRIVVLALLTLALLVQAGLSLYGLGRDAGYDQGRRDVCRELADAGFPIGGASSTGPAGTERTGC